MRALACRPKSGAAVTGPGDMEGVSSLDGRSIPLWANVGKADLFCLLAAASTTEVSSLSEPGRPADGGVLLTLAGLDAEDSCVRILLSSDECSLELAATESLSERGRASAMEDTFPPSCPG